MNVTDHPVRLCAGGGLSISCGLLVYAIGRSSAATDEGLVLLFGTVIPFVLATGGVVTGIAIATSELDSEHLMYLVGWPLIGMAFAGALSVLTVAFEVAHGIQMVRTASVLLNNVTGGLAGGLLLGVFHVRSRRRAATIERQRDELKLLNRIVRHDISNNLTVALGMCDYVASHVPPEDREYHDRLHRSLQNAVTLTENARAAIEVFEDAGGLSREPVALGPIVTEQVEVLRATYPDAEIVAEGSTHVRVVGNDLLSTVFRNLLTNAVRHSTAATPVVEVTVEETDTAVLVTVADDGPGVSDELQAAVTAAEAGMLDRQAAGIGLSIVTAVVAACGGDLRVGESDLGGARFIVSLPKPPVSRASGGGQTPSFE